MIGTKQLKNFDHTQNRYDHTQKRYNMTQDRAPIPARKLTYEELEKAREEMRNLKKRTPENIRREKLFKEWTETDPAWQAMVQRFGDGKK